MDPARTQGTPRPSITIGPDTPHDPFEQIDISPLSSDIGPENQQDIPPTPHSLTRSQDDILEARLDFLDQQRATEADALWNVLLPRTLSSASEKAGSRKMSGSAIRRQAAKAIHDRAQRASVILQSRLEFYAAYFSFACFWAIYSVMWWEEGQPLAQWNFRINSGYEISPTAVVSFIAALGKSSFLLTLTEIISHWKWRYFDEGSHSLADLELFDSASRGPLGALWLIWKLRWNNVLASLAAICVLLSLMVDPFVQLVSDFPIHTQASDLERAEYRTATVYNVTSIDADSATSRQFSLGGLDPSMRSAMLGGFYGFPLGHTVDYCSSGNCTFTSLSTLGVCSKCLNITSSVVSNCSSTTLREDEDNEGVASGWILETCDYDVGPFGRELKTSLRGYVVKTLSDPWSSTRWNSSLNADEAYQQELNVGQRAVLVGISAIKLPRLESRNDSLGAGTAWECSLELCEKTFEVINVTHGAITTSDPIERSLIVQNLTGTPPTKPGIRAANVFASLTDTNGTAPKYWINNEDYMTIRAYLESLLTVGWWDNGRFKSTRGVNSSTDGYLFEPNHDTPDIGASLAESEDIPHLFQMVAANMTESIRLQGAKDWVDVIDIHPGIANRTEAYIHVRYGYLAMPFGLSGATIFLIVLLAIYHDPDGSRMWKSSSLALLFHSLSGFDPDDRVPDNALELEWIAESMKGKLSKGEWPPRFIKED
ncbi:hypothetical protein PRZ48_011232 [Zasmidium cellare]|uniref:Uncharacterized protein n=1 Tax=Zasmidium cellare TaxID=395010 RepID=A0ABR0EAT8_ZASCE|nr:hypothetical protein PRZ48_011232 [Zasmidium cellare]